MGRVAVGTGISSPPFSPFTCTSVLGAAAHIWLSTGPRGNRDAVKSLSSGVSQTGGRQTVNYGYITVGT